MQVREEPTGERPLFSRVDETPFEKWFGDSKVVDGNGAPLVVYHGTGAQFDAFSKDAEPMNYETDRGLFHFTTDRKEAESYSKHGGAFGEIENKNPRVISAYVSLQNPFVIDNSDSPTEDWDRNGDTYLDEAKRTGRDGIIIQTEDGKNKLVIAFEPTQIKSTANRGTFDPNDDRIMYSRLDGERSAPFFSKLERVVEESQTTRAPASQWTATLAKAGVKKEELEWTGVFDWLDMQEGPVEKAALLGVIRDGGIKVEEVVLGENRAPTQREIEARADEAFERDLNEALADAEDESDEEAIQDRFNGGYNSYLLHAESELKEEAKGFDTQFEEWSSDPKNKSYRELLITLPLGQGGNPSRAPATHWDQDAVVAHTRFMEKRDADGKRVLFLEEVQGDWPQALLKQRKQMQARIDTEFQAIVERMKEAGVLKEVCD
jgi:hypothetical protein